MESLVVTMRSAVLACLAVIVLLSQNVNSDDNAFFNNLRLNRYRRPVVVISAKTGAIRRYLPTPTTDETSPTPEVKKVRLDIYYETDCPDSMRFISTQLYPLFQEMEDALDIHLVPYGKASERYNERTQRYDFICQHGSSECHGNMVQSCVMSLYPRKKDHLNFINCMERYPRPSVNGRKCARRFSLDWDKIDKCVTSEEGNRLQHEMAQKTDSLNPRLYFVPWIVVDGVFSPATQRRALWNLKDVVCENYKGNHPKCQK